MQSSLLVSPFSFLTCMLPVTLWSYSLNPVLTPSRSGSNFNFTHMSGLAPLTFDHLFLPSQIDLAFKAWHSCGLVYFADRFDKNSYFRYFQVCSFTSKYFSSYPYPPKSDTTYNVINLNPYSKRLIFKIYDLIQNLNIPS